jgi:hypothetical protein
LLYIIVVDEIPERADVIANFFEKWTYYQRNEATLAAFVEQMQKKL